MLEEGKVLFMKYIPTKMLPVPRIFISVHMLANIVSQAFMTFQLSHQISMCHSSFQIGISRSSLSNGVSLYIT